MARHCEVEVTINSARNLKNINWKHGNLLPYAVIWVDRSKKYRTKVDRKGGENPNWNDQKLKILIPDYKPIKDRFLFIDIVHDDTQNALPNKIVGSGKLSLPDAGNFTQTVTLRRPSGRPQGKVEVTVSLNKIRRYDWYSPEYSTSFSTYGSAYAQPPPTPPSQSLDGCSKSLGRYVSVKKSNNGLSIELGLGAVAAVAGGLAKAVGVISSHSSSESKSSSESESSYCQRDDSNCEPDEGSSSQPDGDCSMLILLGSVFVAFLCYKHGML